MEMSTFILKHKGQFTRSRLAVNARRLTSAKICDQSTRSHSPQKKIATKITVDYNYYYLHLQNTVAFLERSIFKAPRADYLDTYQNRHNI